MRNFLWLMISRQQNAIYTYKKDRFIEYHNFLPKYFLDQIILFSSKIRIIVWPLVALYDVFTHFFSNKDISTNNIWQSTHHCVLHLSIFAIKSSYQTNLNLTSLFELGWKFGLILFDHIAHLLKWNTHHPWTKTVTSL